MTREIKFRGLDINGRWFYGLLSISQGKATQPKQGSYISNSTGSPFAYQVRPETVGQFIGMRDKNGKEIYDGDILKYTFDEVTKVNVIEFQPPIFTYRDSMRWSLHQDEIIGNIYENPDLLKENVQ